MDSDADSMIYTLSSQIGYQFEKEDLFFTPIVGLSYSMSSVDGIDEDGSIFAVETDDQDYDSLLSKLGFRTGFIKVMNDEDFFTLEFRSFWYHEFMDTERDLDARFTSGGTEFNVDGIENEEDSFTAGLGFRYDFGSSEVVVEYDYEMSSDFEAHNIGLSWVIRI